MSESKATLLSVMGNKTTIPRDKQGRNHGACRWNYAPPLPSIEEDNGSLLDMFFYCIHGSIEGELVKEYEK